MKLVPVSYNLRSLWVRKSATVLTVASIGATVAVLSGVLALQRGFVSLFAQSGRADVAVFMRPGATSENQSAFARDRADILMKSTPELAEGADGQPLASAETYLAVRMRKVDGGETNVPVRGVQPATMTIRAEEMELIEGGPFRPGTDEVIVGERLTRRIRGCQVGETIQINTVPFKVVGVFANDGPFASEIWGDLDRMMVALERAVYSRVIGVLREGVDIEALSERLEDDQQVPAKVMTEVAYLSSQTDVFGTTLEVLGGFLGVIMGLAAIFTTTNTMLAALAARTHEIGVLSSIGFRPVPIFLSFLFEALLLGLAGGVVGTLFALPLNGIETGTTNFQTFTEVAFAFRVTPDVLATAVAFALVLGLAGGALPAWRAARMTPVDALRRG